MKKEKCYSCKKKEFMIFVCECCNNKFCLQHRLPEVHLCKSDYSKKELLLKNLEKIECQKIDKI